MPQNAIIAASGGDYTTPIAWEAAEQNSDYGSITVGRLDGFFDLGASQLDINGVWVNGARLEPFDSADAFDGTERMLCGMTSTSAITFRNRGQNIQHEGLEVYNSGSGRAYSNTSVNGDLDVLNSLYKSDTGNAVSPSTNTGTGFVGCVIVSENGNPHRDGVFDKCSFFGNTTSAFGTGGTNTTDNSVAVNLDTGTCYRGSVTQSNNASTDTSADTLDNIVVATEFVDPTPVASGDYRIKVGSDLDTNGIGAFIQDGGITVTVTENGPSFTETINTTVLVSVINSDIIESGPNFTESINVDLGVNITSAITELGPNFTESININVSTRINVTVAESGPSFTENITASLPITITVNPRNTVIVQRKSNTVKIKRKSNNVEVR